MSNKCNSIACVAFVVAFALLGMHAQLAAARCQEFHETLRCMASMKDEESEFKVHVGNIYGQSDVRVEFSKRLDPCSMFFGRARAAPGEQGAGPMMPSEYVAAANGHRTPFRELIVPAGRNATIYLDRVQHPDYCAGVVFKNCKVVSGDGPTECNKLVFAENPSA